MRLAGQTAFVLLMAVHWSSVPCAGDAPLDVVESFDIYADGDNLIIPVTTGGRRYSFVVDTGFSSNVVDAGVIHELPLLPRRERVNGGDKRPMRALGNAFVGRERLPADAEAVQIDMSEFRKISGHDISGILGMPFLREHIIEVDFDRGRFSFLKSVPDSAGRAFPLVLDRYDRPMLEIDIAEDDAIPFLIDTGLVGVGMSVKLHVRRFDLLSEQGLIELLDGDARSLKVEGFTRRRRAWLKTFTLGDTIHKRIGVVDGDESALGTCFFSRYVVTFDFRNKLLYLKPGKRIAEPDRVDVSGVHIWRVGIDGVEIASVAPNCPGSAAGLKAGDRMLKCDGKPVSSMRLFQIRTILATEGLRVKLDIDGSTGRRNVALDLTRPKREAPDKAPRK